MAKLGDKLIFFFREKKVFSRFFDRKKNKKIRFWVVFIFKIYIYFDIYTFFWRFV